MAEKQTSPEISSLAGRYLAMGKQGILKLMIEGREELADDMLSVCASCLAQDETPEPESTVEET
jgi:hypothetical protein